MKVIKERFAVITIPSFRENQSADPVNLFNTEESALCFIRKCTNNIRELNEILGAKVNVESDDLSSYTKVTITDKSGETRTLEFAVTDMVYDYDVGE